MNAAVKVIAPVAALLLAACAHGPSARQVSAPATSSLGEQSLSELPTQQLERGQCALVLWSRDSTPVRFVVTLDQPAVARVGMKGRVVELARVAQSGQSIHGQFPEQQYRGEGVSLEISFVPDEARELAGGAVVSSVVVEYVDPNGWTSVIPAVGLIACQR
jgi:hypothetical protein